MHLIRGVVVWRVVAAISVHAVLFADYRLLLSSYDRVLRPIDVWVTTYAGNGLFELAASVVLAATVALLFSLPRPSARQWTLNFSVAILWSALQIPLRTGVFVGFSQSAWVRWLRDLNDARVTISFFLPILAALLLLAHSVSTSAPTPDSGPSTRGERFGRPFAAAIGALAVSGLVLLNLVMRETGYWTTLGVIVGASAVGPLTLAALCSLPRPGSRRLVRNGIGALAVPLAIVAGLGFIYEPARREDDPSALLLIGWYLLFVTAPGMVGLSIGLRLATRRWRSNPPHAPLQEQAMS